MDVLIVDYGLGNPRSVQVKLERSGFSAQISADSAEIAGAKRLILPGVGSFRQGMENLLSAGLVPVLRRKVLEEGTPILGICLGMQLLAEGSEEGDCEGLGWIEGRSVRFDPERINLRVPHVGRNTLHPVQNSFLFDRLEAPDTFYFTHSFHLDCPRERILATTHYGQHFASVVGKDNLLGVQFHPEKSHDCGMRLLANFVSDTQVAQMGARCN